MFLPDNVMQCITLLEQAGFSAYAVGGCVRDACLGLPPQDYDLCSNALPEQLETVFSRHPLVLAGKKHGTVGVIFGKEVVEITTFRQEGGYRDNRHPDWVRFVGEIGSDLARRDFTVNAMAYSPSRGFADPFGGRQDLRDRILRTVGDPETRFREDSLRILRGVRFAVKYRLAVEEKTMDAMVRLAPLMENLARERVFDELCKLLPRMNAEDLCRFAPIVCAVLPELSPMVGFDQRTSHHAYDLYTHTAHVVAQVPEDPVLRWAALLHDTGKPGTFTVDEAGNGHFYGHAGLGAEIGDRVLRRMKAPAALREQAVFLIENHMNWMAPDKKLLRRRISRMGMDRLLQLLALQEADMNSKGTCSPEELAVFPQIRQLLAEIEAENQCVSLKTLAVNGNHLLELGFEGPEIGRELNRLLELVVDQVLPNDRSVLLQQAKAHRDRL